jgi:hypothetical protein
LSQVDDASIDDVREKRGKYAEPAWSFFHFYFKQLTREKLLTAAVEMKQVDPPVNLGLSTITYCNVQCLDIVSADDISCQVFSYEGIRKIFILAFSTQYAAPVTGNDVTVVESQSPIFN